jgi:D-alanyl-D-alanine carboxypeptidase
MGAAGALRFLPAEAGARHHQTNTSTGETPVRSGILIDTGAPSVILADRDTARIHPASLTKLMTMHLAFLATSAGILPLRSLIRVSAYAASMPRTSLGLAEGDTLTVDDAFSAMAVHSCNDVAVAVAERLTGTEAAFAAAMNVRARMVALTASYFTNASGLPDPGNISTARDLALLGGRIVLTQPLLWRYLGTKQWVWQGQSYTNSNRLLGRSEGVDGGKTGYVQASGHNLLVSGVRADRRLLGVVSGRLSAEAAAADMDAMLDKGFARPGRQPA